MRIVGWPQNAGSGRVAGERLEPVSLAQVGKWSLTAPKDPKRACRVWRTRIVVGEVKTTKSRRTMHLPAPVVEVLRAHRRRQNEEQMASSKWAESGLGLHATT
jgi:hypothetical protein